MFFTCRIACIEIYASPIIAHLPESARFSVARLAGIYGEKITMYAVIISGGKQYRVIEGQTLKLEKLPVDVGGEVNIDKVLMVVNGEDIRVGKPCLADAKVSATVVSHGRHKKIHIVKFKRRKHHRKQMGHRQYYTEIKITAIAV